MQVSKRKISSSQNEPVFKTIKSQAELKRLIDQHLKAKANERKHKIVEGINEAMEYAKREKIKKKEDEVELEKAKETLEKKAFDIAGYDKQYFDELYKIATKYPRQFNEIIKKSEIDELVKEFDEYKQDKKVEEAVKGTTQLVADQAAEFISVPKTEEKSLGKRIQGMITAIKFNKSLGIKNKRNSVIFAKLPELQLLYAKVADDLEALGTEVKESSVRKMLDQQYGITFGFGEDNFDKYLPIARKLRERSKTNAQKLGEEIMDMFKADPAAEPPPAPTVGKGLTGYIGGKIIKDVLKRFKVLVGEAYGGNTSPEIKAEILDVIDILLKNKKITKPRHKRIVKAFRLDKP